MKMKSYILAVAVSMLIAAIYAFQNSAEITVSFLMFQRVFPQGVWEVVVFSAGAVLMWVFSVLGALESRSAHKKVIKEKDEKIAVLEDEKRSMLKVFKHLPDAEDGGSSYVHHDAHQSSGDADERSGVSLYESHDDDNAVSRAEKESGAI